jgi:hypothetical protein
LPARYDSARCAYFCWGDWHAQDQVLAHFGASAGTVESIRDMLEYVYRTYYGSVPAADRLNMAVERYFTDRELPNSVLSLFCAERRLPRLEDGEEVFNANRTCSSESDAALTSRAPPVRRMI